MRGLSEYFFKGRVERGVGSRSSFPSIFVLVFVVVSTCYWDKAESLISIDFAKTSFKIIFLKVLQRFENHCIFMGFALTWSKLSVF